MNNCIQLLVKILGCTVSFITREVVLQVGADLSCNYVHMDHALISNQCGRQNLRLGIIFGPKVASNFIFLSLYVTKHFLLPEVYSYLRLPEQDLELVVFVVSEMLSIQ